MKRGDHVLLLRHLLSFEPRDARTFRLDGVSRLQSNSRSAPLRHPQIVLPPMPWSGPAQSARFCLCGVNACYNCIVLTSADSTTRAVVSTYAWRRQ
jgi:hypothetical protein